MIVDTKNRMTMFDATDRNAEIVLNQLDYSENILVAAWEVRMIAWEAAAYSTIDAMI